MTVFPYAERGSTEGVRVNPGLKVTWCHITWLHRSHHLVAHGRSGLAGLVHCALLRVWRHLLGDLVGHALAPARVPSIVRRYRTTMNHEPRIRHAEIQSPVAEEVEVLNKSL